MALTEKEEMEMLELEKAQHESQPPPTMFHPSGEKNLSYSNPDLFMAHPITRAMKGAGSGGLGLMQLSGELNDSLNRSLHIPFQPGKAISDVIRSGDEMTQRGRKELGSTGFDWTEAGGAVMGPGVIKGGSLIDKAASLPAKVGTGSVVGALTGATQPVVAKDDFWKHKAIQTGTGATIGAAAPPVVAGAGAALKGVGHALDLVLPGGGERIWNRYLNKIVGEDQKAPVIDALEKSHNLVPGSNQTAAQAVSGIPGGSPIIAAQKITAGTPGGISAQFGERTMQQQAASRKVLNDLANRGTVEQQMVGRVLEKKLTQLINETDTNKLPTIIGKETPAKFLESLVKDELLTKSATGIPRPLDQVFNKGQMKRLLGVAEEMKVRLQTQNPAQKTALQGGVNVAEETRTHLPQMLSRPMMIANAVLRFAGQGVEPSVDKAAAKQFLNPQVMAEALKKLPPSKWAEITDALMAGAPVAGAAVAAQREGR